MELPKEISQKLKTATLNEFQNSFSKGRAPIFTRYIQDLKKNDANFNAINHRGETLLHYLASKEEFSHLIPIVKGEVKDLDLERKNLDGRSPLHYAVIHGNDLGVKHLKDAGADLECRDDTGFTAFHLAFIHRHPKIIELLRSYGADLQASDNQECTPIFHAVKTIAFDFEDPVKQKEYLNRLKMIGIPLNFDVKNVKGQTILHIACQEDKTSFLEKLVAEGAFVDSQDKEGMTPLHLATILDKKEAVEKLVALGARLEVRNIEGYTSFQLALLDRNLEMMKLLLKQGSDVNGTSSKGSTPVHLAVARGYDDETEFLIDQKADLSILNPDGKNILHLACEFGFVSLVQKFLSEELAAVEDKKGNQPLHYAALNGHGAVVELLLKAGANPLAKNLQDFTPRAYALFNEHAKTAQLFEDDLYTKEIVLLHTLLYLTELGPESDFVYPYFAKKMVGVTEEFVNDYPFRGLEEGELKRLQACFDTLLFSHDPGELLSFYKTQHFLALCSGWKSSYCSVAFLDHYLVISNRMERKGNHKTIEIFQFNPEKLTLAIVDNIIKQREMQFDESYDYLFGDLLAILEAKEINLPGPLKKQVYMPAVLQKGSGAYGSLKALDFALSGLMSFERRKNLMDNLAEVEREFLARNQILVLKAFNQYLSLHLPTGRDEFNFKDHELVLLEGMLEVKLLNKIWIKINGQQERFKSESDPLSNQIEELFASSQKMWADLLEHGDQYRLDVFIKGVSCDSEEVQIASCKALMEYAKVSFPVEAIDGMLEALKHSPLKIKVFIIEVCSFANKAGVEKVVKGLLPLLSDPSPVLAQAVMRALKKIGSLAINYVMSSLENSEGKEKQLYIDALKQLGMDQKTIDEILKRMERKGS